MIVAAAAGCGRAPERPRDPAALVAWADSVDSAASHAPGRERTFALARGRLVPVHDSTGWPPNAEAEIRVFSTADGRPLRHLEMPVSESGDWALELAHYFDAQGRTVVFASDGRYFRANCGDGVAHDQRRTVYGPGFRKRASTRRLLDERDRPIPEAECGHPYDFFAGEPRASYDALVQAGRAPR